MLFAAHTQRVKFLWMIYIPVMKLQYYLLDKQFSVYLTKTHHFI